MLETYCRRLVGVLKQRVETTDNDIPVRIGKVGHIVSNEQRRLSIVQIERADGPLPLRELATRVAVAELNRDDREQLGAQERKRVYISLMQTHIPRLHTLGAVSFDEDNSTVGMSDATSPLSALIRDIENRCLSVE